MTKLEAEVRRRERRRLADLNRKAPREDEIYRGAMKVLLDAALIGAGLLIGFNAGLHRAHAATIVQKNHLSATWQTGAPVVGQIPESFPEEVLPEAIDVELVNDSPILGTEIVESVGEPHEEWESLGMWKLSFYCPCRRCSGSWGHRTSSGATCQEGVTAACAILPAGTRVKIDGYGERIVQDTGAGVRGQHLDVFMESHSRCLDHGIKYREVWIKR